MKRSASPDTAARKRSEQPEPTGDYRWIELLKWMHSKGGEYWFCTIPMDVVNLVGDLCGRKTTPGQNLVYEEARLLFQSSRPEIKMKAITMPELTGEMWMQMGALPFVIDAICAGKPLPGLHHSVRIFASISQYHFALIDAGLCRLLLYYLQHNDTAENAEAVLMKLSSSDFFENPRINLTSLFNDDLNKAIVARCEKTTWRNFVGLVSYMIDMNAIRVSAAECQKIRDDCFVACGDSARILSIRSAAFITETCYTRFGIAPSPTRAKWLMVSLKPFVCDKTEGTDVDNCVIVDTVGIMAKIPLVAHEMLSNREFIDGYVQLAKKSATYYEGGLMNMCMACARADMPIDYEPVRPHLARMVYGRPFDCINWISLSLQSSFAAQTFHFLSHPTVLDAVRAGIDDPGATERQKKAFREIAAAIGKHAHGIVKWAEAALSPSDCK